MREHAYHHSLLPDGYEMLSIDSPMAKIGSGLNDAGSGCKERMENVNPILTTWMERVNAGDLEAIR